MAEPLGSAQLQALFESALQNYEKKTGITLAQHPLSMQLQSCHTVEDVTALVQGQARIINDFKAKDKIMKAIKITVSILTPLSDTASLADTVGIVSQNALVTFFHISDRLFKASFPPAKAIHAGLAILLQVCAIF
jgi:hypothetical protein